MTKKLYFLLPIAAVFCIFFYKVILFHQIPFPGDLLIDTSPFKTQSYLGYGPGGYPNKGQGRDVITQLFPWNFLEVETVKKGQIPFWNPYNFSGNVLMQNYQSGIFYPLDLILFLLPFTSSWSVFILLQPLLALLFMYLFLRENRLRTIPSVLGAIGFAFSSFMTVWLEWGNIDHTLLWLPLSLFCIHRLFTKTQAKWFLLLIFSLVSCILAGYIQGAFYVVFFSAVYAEYLFLRQRIKSRSLWITTAAFLLAVCLSGVALIPTISFLKDSTRGAYTLPQLQNLLNPWYYVVTLFASDFFGNPATRNFFLPITYFERVMYVGIPILFFVFYSLKRFKEKSEVRFFAIIGSIVLLLSFNLPGVSYIYRIPLSVITTTVPTRILEIFMFCAVVLAAYGIQDWLEEKKSTSKIPLVFLFFYVLLWIIVLVLSKLSSGFSTNLSISKHNLLLPTFLAAATVIVFYLKNKARKIAVILLFVIIVVDLFYVFNKFTPFTPVSLMYPETPVLQFLQKNEGINRSWGYGSAYIPANYQSYYHIYSADGYDSLFVKEYGELLNSSGNGSIYYPLSRTDANIAPGYGPTDLGQNSYRQKILDLLGVKYVLNLDEGLTKAEQTGTFPHETYQLVWQQVPWQIYKNKKALPRYFLTPSFKVYPNPKDALAAIYTTDISHMLILAQQPAFPTDTKATGSAHLLSYQPNSVTFAVTTTGTQFLFLSDTYYKDWKATIDGKKIPIYRADYALRAIEIPKGSHRVEFYYNSSSFTVGLFVTLFGLMGIGGAAWWIARLTITLV